MIFGCEFLFDTHTLLEQCTYLGYFLLEAPREYDQHGPLLSINWLRLCPQSGACVRSHTIRRRLFIVLVTAAHISPNVFSLRNFLGNVHILFLIIHSISFILIIHHIWTSNYILLFTWQIHSFISSVLHSRPAALGLSCPIQTFWPQIFYLLDRSPNVHGICSPLSRCHVTYTLLDIWHFGDTSRIHTIYIYRRPSFLWHICPLDIWHFWYTTNTYHTHARSSRLKITYLPQVS